MTEPTQLGELMADKLERLTQTLDLACEPWCVLPSGHRGRRCKRPKDDGDVFTDDQPGTCTCRNGFVMVATDSDGAYLGPDPNDSTYAGLVEHTSMYPCPKCRPGLAEQWEHGCFRPNHEACPLCEHRRGRW